MRVGWVYACGVLGEQAGNRNGVRKFNYLDEWVFEASDLVRKVFAWLRRHEAATGKRVEEGVEEGGRERKREEAQREREREEEEEAQREQEGRLLLSSFFCFSFVCVCACAEKGKSVLSSLCAWGNEATTTTTTTTATPEGAAVLAQCGRLRATSADSVGRVSSLVRTCDIHCVVCCAGHS